MRGIKWGAMVAVVLMISVTASMAQETRFLQLAAVPEVQMRSPDTSIEGLRLSIWGENQNMTGLDLGIINQTRGDWKGVGWDVISMIDGDATGVIWDWFGYGRVAGDFQGWHLSFIYSHLQGTTKGLQSGLVCRTGEGTTGVQVGAYTETAAHIGGVQAGIVNRASSVKGLQLGLVNLTDDMYGIQIGLVNYIKTGYLPVFVIANAKF